MPTSFDHSENFHTQGAGANDLNAGGPRLGAIGGADGPTLSLGNCDLVDHGAGVETIENMDNTGWGDTAVDDMVRWDTGGVAEVVRVVTINFGADSDVIEIEPLQAGGITPGVGKSVRVNGAFATAQAAADLLEFTCTNAAGDPVRINHKRHGGTPYVEAFDIDTWPGTSAYAITDEGYNTVPGDIDPMTSTDRTKFEPDAGAIGAGVAVVYLDVAYIRLLNLDCETAVAGKQAIGAAGYGGNVNIVILNCRGQAPTYALHCNNNHQWVVQRCLFENSGTAIVYFLSNAGAFIDNIVRSAGGQPAAIGLQISKAGTLASGNKLYGIQGVGLSHQANSFVRLSIVGNTIADCTGDGIDLGTETDLETTVIKGNIIAHNGGWGIAGAPADGRPHRFALIDYNMIYGNTTGAVQDIEAGGDLIDDSRHDDETNPPFTGVNAAARAANFHELTVEARQIQQLFADDDFKTYPDAGATQAMAGGSAGRGFIRGTA